MSNFCFDYMTSIWFCIIFGVTFGGETGMSAMVLVDLVGCSKFTLSWGIQSLFMGIGNVIGPPIAGKMKKMLTLPCKSESNVTNFH